MQQLVVAYLQVPIDDDAGRQAVVDRIATIIIKDISKLGELLQCLPATGLQPAESTLLYKVHEALEVVPPASDPSVLPQFVYRGEELSPIQVIINNGFSQKSGTKSILRHKMDTGISIYVSTSKDIHIAMEHACRFSPKFVYKIRSTGGICTSEYLKPIEFHSVEQEVVFPYELPASQVMEVAVARDDRTLATGFYSMADHESLIRELLLLGIVKRSP